MRWKRSSQLYRNLVSSRFFRNPKRKRNERKEDMAFGHRVGPRRAGGESAALVVSGALAHGRRQVPGAAAGPHRGARPGGCGPPNRVDVWAELAGSVLLVGQRGHRGD